ERAALRRNLAARRYDIVLDMQALMKSVWLVRQTHGERHGLDRKSAREPLASFFYDVRHTVKFWQPAITRQRELAASGLGYRDGGPRDCGREGVTDGEPAEPDAVIRPAASRPDKRWRPEDWHAVFDRLQEHGLGLRLLAGNDAEAARGQALIAGRHGAGV